MAKKTDRIDVKEPKLSKTRHAGMMWFAAHGAGYDYVDGFVTSDDRVTFAVREALVKGRYLMTENYKYMFTSQGLQYCRDHNIPLATQDDLNAKRENALIAERRKLQARIIEIGDELAKLWKVPF